MSQHILEDQEFSEFMDLRKLRKELKDSNKLIWVWNFPDGEHRAIISNNEALMPVFKSIDDKLRNIENKIIEFQRENYLKHK